MPRCVSFMSGGRGKEKKDFGPRGNKEPHPAPRYLLKEHLRLHFLHRQGSTTAAGVINEVSYICISLSNVYLRVMGN